MSATRDAFRAQSEHCLRLGSPFTARLMALAVGRLRFGGGVADRLLAWPDPSNRADAVPLRLAGALHRLILTDRAPELAPFWPPDPDPDDDALWQAVEGAFARHEAVLMDWLDSPPQTNEVRRAAALIPVFHMIAAATGLPLALAELGASAGLNLLADRFRLTAGPVAYGPADSPVRLTPDWHGAAPPAGALTVTSRDGVDLRPVDAADPAQRLRLLSYLWPDQPDRLARTLGAIDILGRTAVTLSPGEVAEWLEAWLLRPRPGTCTVVFHTIARQYFLPDTCRRIDAALDDPAATRNGPIALVAVEGDGRDDSALLSLTMWPGGDVSPLARVDFHGRWVDWQGPVAVT